jgi:hypothetical protein
MDEERKEKMKEGKVFIVVYVNKEFRDRYKTACKNAGIPMSEVARNLIEPWVEAEEEVAGAKNENSEAILAATAPAVE